MKKRSLKGFTLIELIVVIGIIGVLAAILIPTMIGYVSKSKRAADVSSAREAYMRAIDLIVEEADVEDSFYSGGSTSFSKYDNIEKVNYDLVLVSYLDGLSGTNGNGKVWAPVDSGQQDFCNALNKKMEFSSSDSSIKMKIKTKDSDVGTLNRWYIGYRKDNPQTVEIWVGDANAGGGVGTPLLCLYVQINKGGATAGG